MAVEGRNGQSIFILCDTMMTDICHFTFVQIHRMYDTERQPCKLRPLGDYAVSVEVKQL